MAGPDVIRIHPADGVLEHHAVVRFLICVAPDQLTVLVKEEFRVAIFEIGIGDVLILLRVHASGRDAGETLQRAGLLVIDAAVGPHEIVIVHFFVFKNAVLVDIDDIAVAFLARFDVDVGRAVQVDPLAQKVVRSDFCFFGKRRAEGAQRCDHHERKDLLDVAHSLCLPSLLVFVNARWRLESLGSPFLSRTRGANAHCGPRRNACSQKRFWKTDFENHTAYIIAKLSPDFYYTLCFAVINKEKGSPQNVDPDSGLSVFRSQENFRGVLGLGNQITTFLV